MKVFKNPIVLMITAWLASMTQNVSAALPTATGIATGATANTTSPIQILIELVSTGVGAAGVAIAAIVVLGVAYTLYASFVEAQQKGEWKKFGITSAIGVILVIGVVLLVLLAIDYVA